MSYFTLGAQMGDLESEKTVGKIITELSILLEQLCNKRYVTELDEIAPILRVDGDIWHWGFEGCKSLKLYKKQRYITLDIGVPRDKWKDKSSLDIKEYLIFNLEEALRLIVQKLKKEKMDIDEKLLLEDFKLLKNEYLNK